MFTYSLKNVLIGTKREGKKQRPPDGCEPSTFFLRVRHDIHYTMGPDSYEWYKPVVNARKENRSSWFETANTLFVAMVTIIVTMVTMDSL